VLKLLILVFNGAFKPILTVEIHDYAALVETVMALGEICLHDEAEILLSCLHLQHRSIVVAEMIICPLPEVCMRGRSDGEGISHDAEALRLARPLHEFYIDSA